MFRPHHQFNNCPRIERSIGNLINNALVTQEVQNGFNTYHYALIHKLKCANIHLEKLKEVLENTPPASALSISSNFILSVNICIDGFFYSGESALDILAREVLSYYGLVPPPRVYFSTLVRMFNNHRLGHPLLQRITNVTWKNDFSNYRNALTHEVLVGTTFSIKVETNGGTQTTRIVSPLPDNPRAPVNQRTYINYPDVLEYCTNSFRRLLNFPRFASHSVKDVQ